MFLFNKPAEKWNVKLISVSQSCAQLLWVELSLDELHDLSWDVLWHVLNVCMNIFDCLYLYGTVKYQHKNREIISDKSDKYKRPQQEIFLFSPKEVMPWTACRPSCGRGQLWRSSFWRERLARTRRSAWRRRRRWSRRRLRSRTWWRSPCWSTLVEVLLLSPSSSPVTSLLGNMSDHIMILVSSLKSPNGGNVNSIGQE